MADSPNTDSDGVVSFTIEANGSAISDEIQVLSIEVLKTINRIGGAILVFQDGDMPTKDFPLSNEDDCKPGS